MLYSEHDLPAKEGRGHVEHARAVPELPAPAVSPVRRSVNQNGDGPEVNWWDSAGPPDGGAAVGGGAHRIPDGYAELGGDAEIGRR